MTDAPVLLKVTVKTPSSCVAGEIADFVRLACEGGEVASAGLRRRVQSAEALVFGHFGSELVAIAGIKRPLDTYREKLESSSGVLLPSDHYPFELGWAFVQKAQRGQGLSRLLVAAALEAADGRGMFATSWVENAPMHATLSRFGFVPTGNAYQSSVSIDRMIQVFIRDAAESIEGSRRRERLADP